MNTANDMKMRCSVTVLSRQNIKCTALCLQVPLAAAGPVATQKCASVQASCLACQQRERQCGEDTFDEPKERDKP